MKLNNKGFTLIELLAVIVILGLLIAIAVPSVARFLNEARRGTFIANAQSAISAVRDDFIINNYSGDRVYELSDINNLLEKKLEKSPYGENYSSSSYIYVESTGDGIHEYSVCLTDGKQKIEGHEENIDEAGIETSNTACVAPELNNN